MYSFRDQLQPVSTGFLRFFAVPVHSSCILKISGTGPIRSPSKKGNRTETGPDFKALFSLNSMIAREDVSGVKMDSISDLIGALLRYCKHHPDKKLVLFKSDVSAAY